MSRRSACASPAYAFHHSVPRGFAQQNRTEHKKHKSEHKKHKKYAPYDFFLCFLCSDLCFLCSVSVSLCKAQSSQRRGVGRSNPRRLHFPNLQDQRNDHDYDSNQCVSEAAPAKSDFF